MIIASWNIRGFNLPLKHQAMQNFLRSKEVTVMAILETKLNYAACISMGMMADSSHFAGFRIYWSV